MPTLYINQIHGSPELDMQLVINGTSATATLVSANNFGGTFGYPSGIEYRIEVGGVGFSINTGAFSYSTSGQIIKVQSGTVGTGGLRIYGNCQGGDGCFKSSNVGQPTYNASSSSGINSAKLIVYPVASQYLSSWLTNTLIVDYTGLSEAPSNLNFNGIYIELGMSASFSMGSGSFQSFTVSPRSTSGGANIATWNKSYSGWTFTDSELLTIYNNLSTRPYGEQQMYLYLTATTTDGYISGSFGIKVGGTTWKNESGTWKRTVPYLNRSGTWSPTIMYMNTAGSWRRGNP